MIDSGARPPLGRLSGDVLPSLVAGCGVVGREAADIVARFAESVPREPSTSQAADLLLALVGLCADSKHPFVYLSVPITTGRADPRMVCRERPWTGPRPWAVAGCPESRKVR